MNIHVHWLPLLPVIIPAVTAVFVLVIDAIVPRRRTVHFLVAALALAAATASTVPSLTRVFDDPATSLCQPEGDCFYVVDNVSAGLQAAALLSALVVTLLAAPIRIAKSHSVIQVSALLSVTAGATGVVAARDLPAWLVMLELATVPTIALVAVRARRTAVDGALNLLTTSLVSFAVTAMGVAMWFAATGSATFDADTVQVAIDNPDTRPMLAVALMLIVAGVGFKLSLVPFHAWTPEGYAGASVPMTALLATVSKIAALGALLVVARPVAAVGGAAMVALAVIAVLSMTLGNVMALRENDTLRFLAWSSVSQAGWIVLPLATSSSRAVHAAAAYVVIYAVATLGIFIALTAVAHQQGRSAVTAFDALRGLGRRQPWTGVLLSLGLLTLAGLPPAIGGVLAKVAVLHPVADERQWVLLVLAAINAMIGVAVYLRWVWQIFSSGGDTVDRGLRAHPLHLILLVAGVPALVVVNLAPQLLFWLVD